MNLWQKYSNAAISGITRKTETFKLLWSKVELRFNSFEKKSLFVAYLHSIWCINCAASEKNFKVFICYVSYLRNAQIAQFVHAFCWWNQFVLTFSKNSFYFWFLNVNLYIGPKIFFIAKNWSNKPPKGNELLINTQMGQSPTLLKKVHF